MSSAAFLLAPNLVPDPTERLEFLRWEKHLGKLVHYRGSYRELKIAGVTKGFLSKQQKPRLIYSCCEPKRITTLHLK